MDLYRNQSGDNDTDCYEQACSKPALSPSFLAAQVCRHPEDDDLNGIR